MINQISLFISSGLLIFWGIAHLFPTRSVVKNFGEISEDNKKIITMEWINEGVTLVLIGAITIFIALFGYGNPISFMISWINIIALNTLSLISLFTGFKINFLPFKLCPIIFTSSSIFIIVGIYL